MLRPFYYRETDGIRVTVQPLFVRNQSRPARGHYVFAYFVRIENVGANAAQLLRRRWLIHDSIGEDTEVEGEGVVGQQPRIEPGEVHEYESFCVLKSPSGYMEGSYLFVRPDGSEFDARIPRFLLDASEAGGEKLTS
ncbi:MAG TPA: Co2+/Mg2+ efflux protein ApaG [Gemmatimonadaceae bacterium]|jgi:ApaG protein|nr:Co2+/Mg2+ efflux protein ApaG [Gemmatimonadaceae bacterium]